MKVQRGYKTELQLNNAQTTACLKHAGAARYTYNWGLSQKKKAYENGEKTPNAIELHRRLNALKPTERSSRPKKRSPPGTICGVTTARWVRSCPIKGRSRSNATGRCHVRFAWALAGKTLPNTSDTPQTARWCR